LGGGGSLKFEKNAEQENNNVQEVENNVDKEKCEEGFGDGECDEVKCGEV